MTICTMNVSVLKVRSGLLNDCTALNAASRDLLSSSFRIDGPRGIRPSHTPSPSHPILHQLPYTLINSITFSLCKGQNVKHDIIDRLTFRGWG